MIEAFHCDGNVARNMESGKGFRMSIGISEPAAPNGTNEMSSWPGLWDGLALFSVVLMPSTSNEMKINLTDVSMWRVSGCVGLSLMRVEKKHLLNPSTVSAGDSMLTLLNMIKFGITEALDCENASKIKEVLRTG